MTGAGAAADDLVQPFQVEGPGLRGRLIRLGPSVDSILVRHDYPEPVAALLGEALALTATLASGLKFDGVFSLQTKGDGPVSVLVADYRTPGALRGYANIDKPALDQVARAEKPSGMVPRLLGAGYLAFTVDQGPDTERYQGIVDLAGATLADCAQNYFQQSEQLETGIRLAAARVPDGQGGSHWRAGGLLIQRLPDDDPTADEDEAEDAWRRALMMVGSVRNNELVDPNLPPHDLLYRLFHEDGVRVFDPHDVREGCRCSRERVETVLRSLPPQEVAEVAEDGRVTVTCEFCNTPYTFPIADFLPKA